MPRQIGGFGGGASLGGGIQSGLSRSGSTSRKAKSRSTTARRRRRKNKNKSAMKDLMIEKGLKY